MLEGIGPTELIVVAVVLTVLFGGSKIPELAKGMAEAFREFRRAVADPV